MSKITKRKMFRGACDNFDKLNCHTCNAAGAWLRQRGVTPEIVFMWRKRCEEEIRTVVEMADLPRITDTSSIPYTQIRNWWDKESEHPAIRLKVAKFLARGHRKAAANYLREVFGE